MFSDKWNFLDDFGLSIVCVGSSPCVAIQVETQITIFAVISTQQLEMKIARDIPLCSWFKNYSEKQMSV